MRRDGTVAWNGNRFEVDYVLAGKQVQLVIDPHAGEALRVEDEDGEVLSMAIPLDVKANAQRTSAASRRQCLSVKIKRWKTRRCKTTWWKWLWSNIRIRLKGAIDMYRQHFGLTAHPLKATTKLWDDGNITHLQEQFQWLLDSPGIGLLTGEPGVGKTAEPPP